MRCTTASCAGSRRSLLSSAHDQHRAARVVQQAGRDAAQHRGGDRRAAAAAGDDHAGVDLFGELQQSGEVRRATRTRRAARRRSPRRAPARRPRRRALRRSRGPRRRAPRSPRGPCRRGSRAGRRERRPRRWSRRWRRRRGRARARRRRARSPPWRGRIRRRRGARGLGSWPPGCQPLPLPSVAMPETTAIDALLQGLNAPQRDAVTHGEGPLLILAGAGSGKTRVLTHRIAYLLRTGQARADEILAITFTNKAAQEMRERVELLVGRATRAMWVMTFHSACARMLRADAHRLGYTRQFTIYDAADSRRLIKKCLDDLDIDVKRFTPRAMQSQISDAKNKLRSADDYRQMVGSFFEQTVADVYEHYEREIHRMNAMDFDDLLVRAVNLLELFQEVRDRYTAAFRWILVDEYQDTNHAQYRWLQLLASEHRNLAVVGDDDQCLVEGTPVTMADGSTKPIEEVADRATRCCRATAAATSGRRGSPGRTRPPRGRASAITHARRPRARQHPRAHALRRLPDGSHAAAAHDLPHVAADKGFRVGVDAHVHGPRRQPDRRRCARGRCRSTPTRRWVVRMHDTEAEARASEAELSLRYGIPTLPFVARPQGPARRPRWQPGADRPGLRGRRQRCTAASACSRQQVSTSTSRITCRGVTKAGGATSPSRSAAIAAGGRRCTCVAIGGRDPEVASARSSRSGLSVRPAKAGFAELALRVVLQGLRRRRMDVVWRIQAVTPMHVRYVARLGAAHRREVEHAAVHARAARSGRAWHVFVRGRRLRRRRVGRARRARPAGLRPQRRRHPQLRRRRLVTHNSIYGFRGADINNILDFEDDFPDAHVVKLEQNYRSTQTILSAANAVVATQPRAQGQGAVDRHRRGRPVRVRELARRARRGAVRGRRDRADGRRGRLAQRDRRLLPDERAVAGARGHAGAGADRLPGHRRHEVLRARGDQGRDRVPDFIVNPQDEGAFTRIANSPKRGLGQTSLSRVLAHADTIGVPVWEAAEAPGERARARHRGAEGARALHVDDGAAARARGGDAAGRRPAAGDAERDRLHRGARGRAHDRGAGADREPRGARAGRARVRRDRRGAAR